MLPVLHYDQSLLVEHPSAVLTFYAYNLGKSQPIRVLHNVKERMLSLYTEEITFSEITSEEAAEVSRMKTILDAMPRDSKHRECLEALLSLYSTAAVGHGHAVKEVAPRRRFHEQCFVEIKFAVLDNVALTNNFVCIVPIQCSKNGGLVVLEPYHGALWENMTERIPSFVVMKQQHEAVRYSVDTRVNTLRALFDQRTLMRWSIAVLCPFLHSTRDARARRGVSTGSRTRQSVSTRTQVVPKRKRHARGHETTMYTDPPGIFKQSLGTYGLIYGDIVPIGITQRLLVAHCNDKQKAENILCAAVQLVGAYNRLPRADMVDVFYTMIVYCTMMCSLGNELYRRDFLGEDLNCLYVHTLFWREKILWVFYLWMASSALAESKFVCVWGEGAGATTRGTWPRRQFLTSALRSLRGGIARTACSASAKSSTRSRQTCAR